MINQDPDSGYPSHKFDPHSCKVELVKLVDLWEEENLTQIV